MNTKEMVGVGIAGMHCCMNIEIVVIAFACSVRRELWAGRRTRFHTDSYVLSAEFMHVAKDSMTCRRDVKKGQC